MISQTADRAGSKQFDYGSPPKVSRFLTHHRPSNSQVRTQHRKTSGHHAIHSSVENSPGMQMISDPNSTTQRPFSKNEQDNAVARNPALEEY